MAKPELDPAAAKAFEETMLSIGKTIAEARAMIQGMNADMINLTNSTTKQNSLLEEQGQKLRDGAAAAADAGQSAINSVAQEQNRIKIMRQKANLMRDENGALTEAGKLMNGQADAAERNVGASELAATNAQNVAMALTGVSGAWKGTLIGSFMQGDFNQNLELAAKALADQFSLANMLGSALMKVQEATMAMVWQTDALFASTNQLTNGTGEYNEMIMETHDNNAQFNVDLEAASEAVTTLYQDMSQFTEMTEKSQAALVEATAQLAGLGIDAASTAANMEVLNKALGMSAEEAIAVQKDFAAMAADLGVNAAQISKDFSANASTFTAYGKEAVRVFKNTAAAAKATGISMDKLLGITGQFDTFEGAANAAGKLNAILGGGMLNSMDLLNASEEERIRMLIQSVDASGKSWESMNKFERMAVANAAGISDMTDANKLFGQSLAEYDQAQKKVEDNSAAQAELEERAKAATSAQDKFKRIMEQFAVAVIPVLSVITFFADALVTLNDMTGGILIPTLIALLGVMVLINWATSGSTVAMVKEQVTRLFGIAVKTADVISEEALALAKVQEAAASKAAAIANQLLVVAFIELAVALVPLTPAIAAIGYAIGSLGLAIAAPFIAIAVLVWSLKELIIAFMEMPDAILPAIAGLMLLGAASLVFLPMLGMGIAMFVLVLAKVAPFMLPVATGLMYLAGAAALFGVAAYLLGAGFKALSEGLTDFPILTMLLIAPALVLFSAALLLASPFMLIGGLLFGAGALLAGAGLNTLASGVEGFTGKGMVKALYDLIPSLIAFSFGLLIAAVPMLYAGILFGVGALVAGAGLSSLADGIERFTDRGTLKAMTKIIGPLIAFSYGLLVAAIPMLAGGIVFVIGAMLAGLGLSVLASGIEDFTGRGMLDTMLTLSWQMLVFALGMLAASAFLLVASPFILIGGLIMGTGLSALAEGIEGFTKKGMIVAMTLLGAGIWAFASSMALSGWLLVLASPFILVGGILMGLGLAALGFGINMFDKSTLAAMIVLGMFIGMFATSMAGAAIPLLFAAPFILVAGLVMALGLAALALSIGLFDSSILANMAILGPVLAAFALSMFNAAIPLLIASPFILIAGVLLGIGLGALAMGLKMFGRIRPEWLAAIGPALFEFSWGLMKAAIPLLIAAVIIGPASLLLGIALAALAFGINSFGAGALAAMIIIPLFIGAFALGLMYASVPLLAAAVPFTIASLLIAPAMAILATPLMNFARAIAVIGPFAGQLPALAVGLLKLGLALPIFGFGLFMLGVFASMPFFDKGLETLTTALFTFAAAMNTISTEKAVALGQVFEGLSKLTDMDNIGDLLFEVAMGIFWMARAIDTLPEEKTIALAMLAPAMADLIDSAVQLTPEAVENVNKLVVAAGEYATAQAEMSLSADMDPFVAAIREALSPSGGGGGGGGQDIILVLNGREFARAVDVAIEKNHSLGID